MRTVIKWALFIAFVFSAHSYLVSLVGQKGLDEIAVVCFVVFVISSIK